MRGGQKRAPAVVVRIAQACPRNRHPVDPVSGAPELKPAAQPDELIHAELPHHAPNQTRRAAGVGQEHAPVEGGNVEPAVVDRHAPDVAGEEVVESRPHPGERIFHALPSASRAAYDEVPRVVRIDTKKLSGGRAHLVRPVVASVLDTRSHIQRAVEGAHAQRHLIQAAAMGAAVDHLRPAARPVPRRGRLPDLEAAVMVERAGVEMMVEFGKFEDPHVRRILESGRTGQLPGTPGRVGRTHDYGFPRGVPRGPLTGRRRKQMSVEGHEGSKRGNIRTTEAGIRDDVEVETVFRTENRSLGAAKHRRDGTHVQGGALVGTSLKHRHPPISDVAGGGLTVSAGNRRRGKHLLPLSCGRIVAPDLSEQIQVLDPLHRSYRPRIHNGGIGRRKQFEEGKGVAQGAHVYLFAKVGHRMRIRVFGLAETVGGNAEKIRRTQPLLGGRSSSLRFAFRFMDGCVHV